MRNRTELLFVYGTLRRGFPLHRRLSKSSVRYIGKGWVGGRLYDLGEYPGAVRSTSGNASIEGEVYELLDAKHQLEELDRVEEYNPQKPSKSLFVRKKAPVKLQDGTQTRAWVYFLPRRPQKARLIVAGDYAPSRSARR